MEHLFSENYTAMKNHYYLIQIGHMIAQFMEIGLRRLKELAKVTAGRLFEEIKAAFRTELLTDEDSDTVMQRRQYRFEQ